MKRNRWKLVLTRTLTTVDMTAVYTRNCSGHRHELHKSVTLHGSTKLINELQTSNEAYYWLEKLIMKAQFPVSAYFV